MSASVAGIDRLASVRPARRWPLWASLALNAFLAAALGAQLGPRWVGHRPPPGMEGLAERLARDLPDEDAARFRDALQPERPLLRAAQDRLDEARAALSRSIARTPYDKALVRQRLSELQQRWQEMSERFDGVLAPTLAGLSDDGRARLAAAFARPRPPPDRRRANEAR